MTGLTNAMFTRPRVYTTLEGRDALFRIALNAEKSAPGLDLLNDEIRRMTIIRGHGGLPHVRLRSRVVYKDLRTKRLRLVRLVDAVDADGGMDDNAVSVLSPIGAALVGLTAGAIFRWQGPDAKVRAVKVLSIE